MSLLQLYRHTYDLPMSNSKCFRDQWTEDEYPDNDVILDTVLSVSDFVHGTICRIRFPSLCQKMLQF